MHPVQGGLTKVGTVSGAPLKPQQPGDTDGAQVLPGEGNSPQLLAVEGLSDVLPITSGHLGGHKDSLTQRRHHGIDFAVMAQVA